VFTGAMAGMFLNHALAVFLGGRYLSRLSPSLLKNITAALFIVIGLVMLLLLALGRV